MTDRNKIISIFHQRFGKDPTLEEIEQIEKSLSEIQSAKNDIELSDRFIDVEIKDGIKFIKDLREEAIKQKKLEEIKKIKNLTKSEIETEEDYFDGMQCNLADSFEIYEE